MENRDFFDYLNKYITVTLDDGTEHSGFVANPKDFQSDTQQLSLDLLNGLMKDTVQVDKIVKIRQSVREDTLSLPVIDPDDWPEE